MLSGNREEDHCSSVKFMPWLLSSQQAYLAWTWDECAGVRTQPGSPEGSGEGNRTCPGGRCYHWSGRSLGLRWRKRRGEGTTQPPELACSPWHFGLAEGWAIYLWAVYPAKTNVWTVLLKGGMLLSMFKWKVSSIRYYPLTYMSVDTGCGPTKHIVSSPAVLPYETNV